MFRIRLPIIWSKFHICFMGTQKKCNEIKDFHNNDLGFFPQSLSQLPKAGRIIWFGLLAAEEGCGEGGKVDSVTS